MFSNEVCSSHSSGRFDSSESLWNCGKSRTESLRLDVLGLQDEVTIAGVEGEYRLPLKIELWSYMSNSSVERSCVLGPGFVAVSSASDCILQMLSGI